MSDYIPGSDAQCDNWLDNFQAVAGANLAALGLTASDATELTFTAGQFTSALAAHQTAQLTAKGARETKDVVKDAAVLAARAVARRVQAKPDVSPLLRQQLGLPERDTTRSKPADVTVAPAPVVEKVGGAQVVLKVTNPETDSVAKPDGVKAIRVFEKVVAHDQTAPEGIDQMTLVDVATNGRITRTFSSADLCKRAYYAFQYVNSAGEAGPVSVIIPASIAA
jgi:hypothetical protein